MQALRFQMWGFPVWQRPRLHSISNQISIGVVSGNPARWAFSARGKFFKPLDDPLVLSRMTRPGADVREAKLLQELSDIARMKVDAETFGNDTLEIDAPPADDAICLTVRAGLHDLRKLSQLFRRQARLRTFRPVVDEALRPRNVEAMNPVAQRLAIHAANLRRRRPVHSIANRR